MEPLSTCNCCEEIDVKGYCDKCLYEDCDEKCFCKDKDKVCNPVMEKTQ
jgi:hypothetical protein